VRGEKYEKSAGSKERLKRGGIPHRGKEKKAQSPVSAYQGMRIGGTRSAETQVAKNLGERYPVNGEDTAQTTVSCKKGIGEAAHVEKG